jgi:hypothetical protein
MLKSPPGGGLVPLLKLFPLSASWLAYRSPQSARHWCKNWRLLLLLTITMMNNNDWGSCSCCGGNFASSEIIIVTIDKLDAWKRSLWHIKSTRMEHYLRKVRKGMSWWWPVPSKWHSTKYQLHSRKHQHQRHVGCPPSPVVPILVTWCRKIMLRVIDGFQSQSVWPGRLAEGGCWCNDANLVGLGCGNPLSFVNLCEGETIVDLRFTELIILCFL